MSGRVLIIEDNTDLAAGIAYNLDREGLEVRCVESGEAGLEAASSWEPGVIILDLMLPGMDGYTVLQQLRARGDRTPVLILSARAEEADRIRGFRLDADQYVTKPFGLLELIERVKSLLRRSGPEGAREISFGDVVIEASSHTVKRAGAPVTLTPREFRLLLALIRREGAVATRLELLKEVWGHRGIVMTRANGDQQVCREFETQGSASYLVVSCRAGSSWAVQLALATANEDGNYRPASGFEVLDSYLESVGAGEPLIGDDELTALRDTSP